MRCRLCTRPTVGSFSNAKSSLQLADIKPVVFCRRSDRKCSVTLIHMNREPPKVYSYGYRREYALKPGFHYQVLAFWSYPFRPIFSQQSFLQIRLITLRSCSLGVLTGGSRGDKGQRADPCNTLGSVGGCGQARHRPRKWLAWLSDPCHIENRMSFRDVLCGAIALGLAK